MSLEQTKELSILSVNISTEKGTIKKPVDKIILTPTGVEGDAHAGNWHRQVSLLARESIDKFGVAANTTFQNGEFAENITTEGMELFKASPLDRFTSGKVVLEVTQIGKKCHGDFCAIFKEVGNCVMPKEGIFCRVLSGGELAAGLPLSYQPKTYRIWVITLSDRASRGEYEDLSGPETKTLLQSFAENIHWNIAFEMKLIPDDSNQLKALLHQAREEKVDFIFTTGGTGIGPRDITIETVKPLLDKEVPGIMEHIRLKYGQEKHHALLSRSICGVMGECLVFTLPGSVKAVKEYLAEITPALKHMKHMLHGLDSH